MGRGVMIKSKKDSFPTKPVVPKVIFKSGQGWTSQAKEINVNSFSSGTSLRKYHQVYTYNTPQSGPGFSFKIDCTEIKYLKISVTIAGSGSTDNYGTMTFYGTIGGVTKYASNYTPSTEWTSTSATLVWDVENLTDFQEFTSSWKIDCRTGDLNWSTAQTITINEIYCSRYLVKGGGIVDPMFCSGSTGVAVGGSTDPDYPSDRSAMVALVFLKDEVIGASCYIQWSGYLSFRWSEVHTVYIKNGPNTLVYYSSGGAPPSGYSIGGSLNATITANSMEIFARYAGASTQWSPSVSISLSTLIVDRI